MFSWQCRVLLVVFWNMPIFIGLYGVDITVTRKHKIWIGIINFLQWSFTCKWYRKIKLDSRTYDANKTRYYFMNWLIFKWKLHHWRSRILLITVCTYKSWFNKTLGIMFLSLFQFYTDRSLNPTYVDFIEYLRYGIFTYITKCYLDNVTW